MNVRKELCMFLSFREIKRLMTLHFTTISSTYLVAATSDMLFEYH